MPYRNVPSPQIGWKEWQELVLLCDKAGGGARRTSPASSSAMAPPRWRRRPISSPSTLKVPVPVVVVGSQRPASALSTDAGLNLVNAVRVAAEPGGARPRRAGAAERRDPGGAGGDQDLDRPDADLPQRRISACSAMRMATRSPGTASRCAAGAGYRIRHPQAGGAAAGRHRLLPMRAPTAPRCGPSSRRAPRASSSPASRRASSTPGDAAALKEARGAGRRGACSPPAPAAAGSSRRRKLARGRLHPGRQPEAAEGAHPAGAGA